MARPRQAGMDVWPCLRVPMERPCACAAPRSSVARLMSPAPCSTPQVLRFPLGKDDSPYSIDRTLEAVPYKTAA